MQCVLDLNVILQEAEAKPEQPNAAEKPTFEDDFFDSISSDATGTGHVIPCLFE